MLACSKCDLEMITVSKRGSFLVQKGLDIDTQKNENPVFVKFIGVDCWHPKILLNFRVSKN